MCFIGKLLATIIAMVILVGSVAVMAQISPGAAIASPNDGADDAAKTTIPDTNRVQGQGPSSSSVNEESPLPDSLGVAEHHLLRRITVFPIRAEASLMEVADEAWWKMREALTENRRFLVASKNFLLQKDVFQARGELTPADAIVLGKLLDANGLVVTYLKGKTLVMRVYEGENGRTLWFQEYRLQPSISLAQQLVSAVEKLTMSFVASVPYQGFVIKDNLSGKTVLSERNKQLVKIEIGENHSVTIGDQVQWIRLRSDSLRPLFMDGATSEIFAEGRVNSVNRGIITAEVLRVTNLDEIREATLVRLPNELKRLQEAYSLRGSGASDRLTSDFLSPGLSNLNQEVAEKKPLVMTLTFIANLATFLILAF